MAAVLWYYVIIYDVTYVNETALLISGTRVVYGNANACIAKPLDRNFSFCMVVARLQTKRAIFKVKSAIGLKLAGGLALG